MKKDLDEIKTLLNSSSAIVLGAGSGLSAAAGFEYGGETFEMYFSYMRKKYGARDMYSAGFAPFEDREEFWGYWSMFIYLERYKDGAKPLYQELYSLLKDKNYFVITTNVDHQFQLSGFHKERLFYTQGDYGLFQEENPKHQITYDNKEMILKMIQNMDPITHKIPSSLIPRNQEGDYLTTNLRCDDNFVEDSGWHKAYERYHAFIDEVQSQKEKVLYLELGVGYNTPVIIKYPFWRNTYENPNSRYVTVTLGDTAVPSEIKKQSYSLTMDLKEFIEGLK